MKIIIIGGGFTGVQLAKRLINEKNDVILIDNDEETVRHASNRLDCSVIQADGNNLEVLEDAGIAKCDALICVTESDEVNMITCSLADAVYPNILKIARVRNYSYYINTSVAVTKHAETFGGEHRPLYGIDFMIHPDVEAGNAIVEAVRSGAVSDVLTFDNSDFELIRLRVEKDSKVDGKNLIEIRNLTDKPFLIAYVESEGISSLPSGATVLHQGDSIGLLTKKENASSIFSLFGFNIKEIKKIALVGAGRIGTIVAEQIVQHKKTTLISRLFGNKGSLKTSQDLLIADRDEALCKAAAQRFPEASVFCADVMDEGFIQEEKLNTYDLVICATHNHEMNMVLAAYLESMGVGKTISLVASSAYADIARRLGINVPIPLRDSVIDSIMSHLRGKTVTGIHTITNGEHEVISYVLPPASLLTGKLLRDVADPGSFLVLLLQKAGTKEFVIPSGDTAFSAGDTLILVTKTSETQRILDVFNGAK
ncbi:NAD-binding protein [Treponema parvum]|uniref:NAD-binding protein n=1 Tax=Treponema parvum TaxID=138851 RepID=UPI001AEBAD4C|nr:NAD-binding protein [Treponema parvum]QTQ17039.1 NAD-binding protein [Treponema parvum]